VSINEIRDGRRVERMKNGVDVDGADREISIT